MTPNLYMMHSQRLLHKGNCLKAKYRKNAAAFVYKKFWKLTADKFRKANSQYRCSLGNKK